MDRAHSQPGGVAVRYESYGSDFRPRESLSTARNAGADGREPTAVGHPRLPRLLTRIREPRRFIQVIAGRRQTGKTTRFVGYGSGIRTIGLVTIPANSAGTREGVARAPAALREAGLVEALRRHTDVCDYGDVALPEPSPERDPASGLIDPRSFVRLVLATRDAVRTITEDGGFPLVIGGDCPLLLGCLVATRADDRIGLLLVDGHEDAYLPTQSPTGEAADTELAFALGLADAAWSPELAALLPTVMADNVRLLGARDAETLRQDGVASLADRVSSVNDATVNRDPGGTTHRACSSLVRPWWFHLDLDVLSTQALPAIDYPQPGGLDWDSLSAVAASALRNEPAGWDVTIYNPDLDPNGVHAARIVGFLGDAVARA